MPTRLARQGGKPGIGPGIIHEHVRHGGPTRLARRPPAFAFVDIINVTNGTTSMNDMAYVIMLGACQATVAGVLRGAPSIVCFVGFLLKPNG